MAMNNRWESYVMFRQKSELVVFWQEFYRDKLHPRVLLLLGKGFDPRMNNILKLFLETVSRAQLECIAFDFPIADADEETKKLYQLNVEELETLRQHYGFPPGELTGRIRAGSRKNIVPEGKE